MTRKSLEKQLDDVWSKLVKAKAGHKCEYCGKITALNSHHIFSRAKKSTRWDTDNGICLCVGHHIGSVFSAHKTPVQFVAWLIRKKGQQFLDLLTLKSNQHAKYTLFELELKLKELRKELKNYEH